MLRRALLVVVMVLAGVLPAFATSFTATYTFTGSPGDQVSEPVDANPVGALFADLTRGHQHHGRGRRELDQQPRLDDHPHA